MSAFVTLMNATSSADEVRDNEVLPALSLRSHTPPAVVWKAGALEILGAFLQALS